ncbi:MAG: peptidase [Bacteroidetes bacterium]|nr:peptidase [Bacteroidota bacterium]
MKKIGWKEKVSFPEFDLMDLPAKIDTGARTSVVHCKSIEIIKRYRKPYVKFVLLDPETPGYSGKEFILPFHKERKVRNSFGQEENRIVVQTVAELFNKKYPIEISLRDRSDMEFPMLLGRSFIRKNFVVDVSRSNLSARYKKKKLKEKKERENRDTLQK